jgi:hypothetical protein
LFRTINMSTTIWFGLGVFSDGRYKLTLETLKHNRNVWFETHGRITICLTEDDIKLLKELPRIYQGISNLNREHLRRLKIWFDSRVKK